MLRLTARLRRANGSCLTADQAVASDWSWNHFYSHFPLSLIQEGQLYVTGESMCISYWAQLFKASLTSLLWVILLTVLADSIHNILIFFCWKNVSSYSHFFSKKFQHICISIDVNFNDSLTNSIVRKLWVGQFTSLTWPKQCCSDFFTCESRFIYSHSCLWDSQNLYMWVPKLTKYNRKLLENM